MTNAEAEQILEAAVARVGEHFDAVQIVASWVENGGTRCAKRGTGNFYARQGMCREFIDLNTAEDAATAIARKLDPPDDSETWKSRP